ncbi:glycoside hydrolase family 2 protein [Rhodococcus sp. H29-C3]|uniref:glycosyl hydrolase 2 galactose-binding domain-containing protein n=1 Tax=Rhodococcus sp. H29-C3 TaxID=3046307 RepID=UPI0024BAE220|nr:glycoside hydrolase family 2 protein [Rhodococcus sp. H29-C3]MDJ0362630.1 beta-mannosidase [Rhodococcus sp. H29-C3]
MSRDLEDFLDGAEWHLTATEPGSCLHPGELAEDAERTVALVPGTVASVVDQPDLDAFDWWFTTSVSVPSGIATTLTFEGIATRATIWVDGAEAAQVRSMFVPTTLDIPAGSPVVDIAVRVESMDVVLGSRKSRGRWRSSLVDKQGLRHERTTLLGRAPVYGPVPSPIGLWRPVTLRPRSRARHCRFHTTVEGKNGVLRVRADLDETVSTVTLDIGDQRFSYAVDSADFDVSLTIPDISLWWPHTHGEPVQYPVSVTVDEDRVHSAMVGFRRTELLRHGRSVELSVNGVQVFARGGCWTPLDPTRLWVEEDVMRAELLRMRDAGLNMIRIVGTMVYEQPQFWSLCGELGILVWQDAMFATTDPPQDPEFVEVVERELEALFAMIGGNPALAVVSGGSETQQQPTMMGIAAADRQMPLLDNVIPEILESCLTGTAYVVSSPSSTSGELHTHVGDGIAHYFGVGGYLRPIADVRTARVRFAAECLAFSIPPERRAVDRMFGSANVAGHHPEWKSAVPRDRGSSWDFEDVRDHYVRNIFAVDPHLVRRTDAELYLDYGRAAVCEAVTESYSHWRRTESECGGALVLTLRDLVPGAGWGLLDSAGDPKAPWYSLARISSPIGVFLVDDGLDGLSIEMVDDTAEPLLGILRVSLHGATGRIGEPYEQSIELAGHSSTTLALDRVIGTFADVNYAYRFGTQTFSSVVVELDDLAGVRVAEATHLIGDTQVRQNDVGLSARVEPVEPGRWSLTVSTDSTAQYVCIDVGGFDTSDSWFHLAAGASRTVTLTGRGPKPAGHVRALNSVKRAQIR